MNDIIYWRARRQAARFEENMLAVPIGTSLEDLIGQFGKPEFTVAASKFPACLAKVPLPDDMDGIIALIADPTGDDPLVEKPLDENYRNYVLFNAWFEHMPKLGNAKTYSESWYTGVAAKQRDILIYTDTRFGKALGAYTAYLFFMEHGKVIAVSSVGDWQPKHFGAETVSDTDSPDAGGE